MEKWKTYLNTHRTRFLEELFELLKIPSVSTDPKFSDDVFETAEFIKEKLTGAGADNTEVFPTEGYPIVYGEKIMDKSLPTVLVYGHYDVQPADPYELWKTPPFEPVIKEDKIYARGACDDKGQLYIHMKAFEMMMQTKSLPCNIKFIFEGEEESGSKNLGPFMLKHKDKLKADVVLVSDTSMLANDTPSITMSLRGLSYIEVEVTGPNRDLHSGIYGGAVVNPVNTLCEMIASLKDKNNRITIPGFYDDVIELTKKEKEEMKQVPFELYKYKKELDIEDVDGEKGYDTMGRASIRPSLDVNGIWGGYTGEGAKTVLPSKAYAKISVRLVANQDSEKITRLFEQHMRSIAPKSVKVKVTPFHGGEPVLTPTDSTAYKAASKAFKTTFGKEPIPLRTGGSIPIIALFKKHLGLDSILMGFGLDSDAIHSPNEHFGLFNFYKGIETVPYFYKYFSEQ